MRQNANIEPITIKRTNDYHNKELNHEITSATSIRQALKNKQDIKKYVPKETYKLLNNDLFFIEDYFPYLKYQILINLDKLNLFQYSR